MNSKDSVAVLLRHTLIGLIFLVPFTALVVVHSFFFPFITGKAVLFLAIASLLVGGWLLLACIDPNARPRRSLMLYALLAFVFVVGIANVLGVSPAQSFWSNFERMEGYITILYLLGFFVVASSVLKSEGLWGWFFHISIGVAILVGLFALLSVESFGIMLQNSQLLHALIKPSVREGGVLGNSIYLAIYMLFHAFLAGLYLVRTWRKNTGATVGYGVVVAIFILVMLLTETRGTVIGLLVSVIVMACIVAVLDRHRPAVRKVALAVAVLGVVLTAGLGATLAFNNLAPEAADESTLVRGVNAIPFVGNVATIDLVSINSATTRFYVWGIAWQGFLERPILGWGQENFSYVFNKYYNPVLAEREQWFDRAHNTFLDWLSAAGVLGLLAYVSLYVVLLWLIWRDPQGAWTLLEKTVLTGAVVAYAVHNIFVFDSLTSYVLFVALMAYVASRTAPNDIRVLGHAPSLASSSVKGYAVAAVCVAIAAGSLYVSAYRPAMTSATLIESLVHLGSGRFERGFGSFERALEWADGGVGTQEVREQIVVKTSEVPQATTGTKARGEFIVLANAQMEDHLERFPRQTRPYVLWGSMLLDVGEYEYAERIIRHALQNSPQKQLIYFHLTELAILQEDYGEAVEAAAAAYALSPEYEEAVIRYVVALRFDGQEARAEELISMLGEKALFEDQLLRPYIKRGEFDKTLDIRQERVRVLRERLESAPEKERTSILQRLIQEQVFIAATFDQMGQLQTAIALLEEIKSTYPQYGPQIDKFIQELRTDR